MIEIRDAKVEDLTFVHQIFNDILLNTTATFEEVPYTLEAWVEVFNQRQSVGFPFLVARAGDKVVGYGTYGAFRKASGYKITVEHSLHVDKNYRGQGIGKKILQELIIRAKIGGIENLVAAVDAENVTSVRLHQKFGFVIAGEMKNVARKFSRDLTLVLLQLNLKAN